jgi:hypothetical protein
MTRPWPKLRTVALLAAGAILVHELRYLAAYGGNASQALAEQGHSYTPLLEAFASLLLVCALGRFAVSLARARRGGVAEARPASFTHLWARASAALAAVYTLQEGFEGAFAPGHPSGLIGVFGHGGWTALIFSVAVGAAIALLTRLAHGALELAAARAGGAPRRAAAALSSWAVCDPRSPRRLDVLAHNLAGRAPPPVRI